MEDRIRRYALRKKGSQSHPRSPLKGAEEGEEADQVFRQVGLQSEGLEGGWIGGA